MTLLGLHNLKKAPGSKKLKRRVGRGNASGKGSYSGKGIKGQRARSGGKSGLVLFGVKNYLLRIPKSRGFKSLRNRLAEVNLADLQKLFNDGDNVAISSYVKKGIIDSSKSGVKILGTGSLTKKLNVSAQAFSASAKAAIEKAGGKIIIVEKNPVLESKPVNK